MFKKYLKDFENKKNKNIYDLSLECFLVKEKLVTINCTILN